MTEQEWKDELARARRLDDDVAVVLYETMEAKRYSVDAMMWQTPALGLVAQSFLLTIALGHDYTWTARLIAAALGTVAAVSSIQLLLKHRLHEEILSRWLERFAEARNWPGGSPDLVETLAYRGGRHPWRSASRRPLRHRMRGRFVAKKSPYVWVAALTTFAVAEMSVFLLGLIDLAAGRSPL